MTTSIHTNTSAMIALQNLNRTNDQLASTQSRVNTGLKVQGAKDNAAVWAVAQGQRADRGSLEAVTTSLNRATSIADVSLAAGEQISDILVELKQKATAAADPSATTAMRTSYNDEFQSLLSSIQSFADNAIFDGSNILDGSATTAYDEDKDDGDDEDGGASGGACAGEDDEDDEFVDDSRYAQRSAAAAVTRSARLGARALSSELRRVVAIPILPLRPVGSSWRASLCPRRPRRPRLGSSRRRRRRSRGGQRCIAK